MQEIAVLKPKPQTDDEIILDVVHQVEAISILQKRITVTGEEICDLPLVRVRIR